MKHSKRRTVTGHMLMDVAKYILTIGLIGGILTDKVNILSGTALVVIATIFFVGAYFTLPPAKEDK